MYALRKLSAVLALSMSMLLLGSGLAAASPEPLQDAGSKRGSDSPGGTDVREGGWQPGHGGGHDKDCNDEHDRNGRGGHQDPCDDECEEEGPGRSRRGGHKDCDEPDDDDCEDNSRNGRGHHDPCDDNDDNDDNDHCRNKDHRGGSWGKSDKCGSGHGHGHGQHKWRKHHKGHGDHDPDYGGGKYKSVKKYKVKVAYYKKIVKRHDNNEKRWDKKADHYEDEADESWSKSKRYKDEDPDRSEYWKKKAKHQDEQAEKCRDRAGYHDERGDISQRQIKKLFKLLKELLALLEGYESRVA